MDPLSALEKEESEEFDRVLLLKRKSKSSTPKRSKKNSLSLEGVETDEEFDTEDLQEEDQDSSSSSSANSSTFLFHPKTRIIDQITSEALILALHKGSGILVAKSDEYKVNALIKNIFDLVAFIIA